MFWVASVIFILHSKDQESIDLSQWKSSQCDPFQRDPSQQDEMTDDNISKMDTSERESTAS